MGQYFVEKNRGINDMNHDPQLKWIDPHTGAVSYKKPFEPYDKFDYAMGNQWTVNGGEVNNSLTQRNLNYQAQLNWARSFGKHSVSAMGLSVARNMQQVT